MQGYHYITLTADTRIDAERVGRGDCNLRFRSQPGQPGAVSLILSNAHALTVIRALEQHLREAGVIVIPAVRETAPGAA